jgi:hypothetical protein
MQAVSKFQLSYADETDCQTDMVTFTDSGSIATTGLSTRWTRTRRLPVDAVRGLCEVVKDVDEVAAI